MAMIECAECGVQISSNALACPKCGNPQGTSLPDPEKFINPGLGMDGDRTPASSKDHSTSPRSNMRLILGVGGILVVLAILMPGIGGHSPARIDSDNPTNLAADDFVTMEKSSYGCEFLSKFTQAKEHYSRGEYSAWAQIINDDPWCFSGEKIAGHTWTVLQIRGNLMQIGITTTPQMQKDMDRYRRNYWTWTTWASKVSPNHVAK